MSLFALDNAIDSLTERLSRVDCQTTAPSSGRALSTPIAADRDSPAADVSAMDGYAVRIRDLSDGGPDRVPIAGEVQPGTAPVQLPPGAALRIFTGAVIPMGAELVVKREDTIETPTEVAWSDAARRLPLGANIRRQGENGRCGDSILPSGTVLTAASIAAAVNFGASQVSVFSRVKCSVIVTGNELLDVSATPQPWQIRDSNGPTVAAMINGHAWLQLAHSMRCGDDRDELKVKLATAIADSDAVILTGGVSKGDYDHVPEVIASLGGEILFHRLPIRPGQPVLGAVTSSGKLILGLPGNPVSTACCMQRIGMPLLRRMGGHTDWRAQPSHVTVDNADDKTLPLVWMRLVRSIGYDAKSGTNRVEYVRSQGSGDLVALGTSDGFVELPPGSKGPGPWPFYHW
ncbi:MAG TPA: molybdopterin molybdenumtransferase MoeA [Planctomycetaceae bacterium]|nr:molybdopterin molybdenumtransferase MoeA [Planctomycetaceae bacterium]